MNKVKYGKVETARVLDNNGSTETTQENFNNGLVNTPVRRRYEIKERVTNDKEEFEQYARFSRELEKDKTMLDPAFKIERSKLGDANGYYYTVWCFTRLEY